MANCPLCSDILLRHVRSSQTYWFCRRCRVEILEKVDYIHPQHSANCQSLEGAPTQINRYLPAGIEGLKSFHSPNRMAVSLTPDT